MADDQNHGEAQASQSNDPTPSSPPPPPVPSMDPKLEPLARTPPPLHFATPDSVSQNLFKVSPTAAMRLLCANINSLTSQDEDTVASPTSPGPTLPGHTRQMSDLAREKADFVRSRSQQDLARLRKEAEAKMKAQPDSVAAEATDPQQPIDGVKLRHTSPASTPVAATPIRPVNNGCIVIGENSQPLLQHSAITRKFFSKVPPPIGIEAYLERVHRFCPMSTAVYLAASVYITRLVLDDQVMVVTPRNRHRLLLSGLRVAMKALEDLSYRHTKFARVGGISPNELTRLEVSLCFLLGFRLLVREEELLQHWDRFKDAPPISPIGQGQGTLSTPSISTFTNAVEAAAS